MKRRILAFLLIVCLLMPLSVAFAERPLGDVDGNDSITAADAALLLRSVVGLSLLDTESRLSADLNEDGIIQASDAALLLRSVVSMTALNEEQAQNADVNADSAINAADAATILRSIVGMA